MCQCRWALPCWLPRLRQYILSVGRTAGYRPGDPAHDVLQGQELRVVEVVDPAFGMPFGGERGQ